MKKTHVALLLNIPTPYRDLLFDQLAADDNFRLTVIYFNSTESNRKWERRSTSHAAVHLNSAQVTFGSKYIHTNFDLFKRLEYLDPDIVVNTGFNPSHLIGFAYAISNRKPLIYMTDGTLESERSLTWLHRLFRKLMFPRVSAFVGPSDGSRALIASYHVPLDRFFQVPLCVDNVRFGRAASHVSKRFDLLFVGRFDAVKNPLFALDVARKLSCQLNRKVSICFAGSGKIESELRRKAAALDAEVNVEFVGFIQNDLLPYIYATARIFLFPTSWDPWGVVANEACATGLPVVVSPAAGCAGSLICHGRNGYVVPLVIDQWVDACFSILTKDTIYQRFSNESFSRVAHYSVQTAAEQMTAAFTKAVKSEYF